MMDDEQQGNALRRQLDDELAGLRTTVAAQESLLRRIAGVTPGDGLEDRGPQRRRRTAGAGRNAKRPGPRSALAIPLAAIAAVAVVAVTAVIGASAHHTGRGEDRQPAGPSPAVTTTVPTPATPEPRPTVRATTPPAPVASAVRMPSAGVTARTIRPSSPAVRSTPSARVTGPPTRSTASPTTAPR